MLRFISGLAAKGYKAFIHITDFSLKFAAGEAIVEGAQHMAHGDPTRLFAALAKPAAETVGHTHGGSAWTRFVAEATRKVVEGAEHVR